MGAKPGFLGWVCVWLIVISLITLPACSMTDAQSTKTREGSAEPNETTSAPPEEANFDDGSITVYAAASLADALQEIGNKFESSHPGVRVRFSFAGSQVLRSQIEQGAQVDVYASADRENMDQLMAENLIEASSVKVFATNRMIVILPDENQAGIDALSGLAKPGIKLVVADQLVPAGIYTRQVILNLSEDPTYGGEFFNRVLENVVSNETDVRQVVAKVELGEADAGIVYASDVEGNKHVKTLNIPEEFNILAEYPMGMLKATQNLQLATEFIAFVSSGDGQEILNRWGFMPGK